MSAPKGQPARARRGAFGGSARDRLQEPDRRMAAWPWSRTVADAELRKDVVAIRNARSGRGGAGARRGFAAQAADGRHRRADRASQQSRPAGGLQRARHRGSRNGGGASAASRRPFRSSGCRTRWSSRSSGASSETSWRSRPCRRARIDRRRPFRAGANCARRKKHCGSPRDARRTYYNAVAARQSAGFLDQAKIGGRNRDQTRERLGETGAMNKIDQSREYVFYAEVTGQLGTARQRWRANARDWSGRSVCGATI